MTWYAARVTAPTRASTMPPREPAEPVQSPKAMRPAPARARAMARRTTGEARSRRKAQEKPTAKRGAVFTSRTEAATEVYDRLATQVAKCTARAAPETSIVTRRRGDRFVHEDPTPPTAKGAMQTAARPIR